jgi:hypothetical protein
MLKANSPSRDVPRVEYDHRAREARLRFERLERVLVDRRGVAYFRPLRRFRLFVFGVIANARGGNRGTGSPRDRRPCQIPALGPDQSSCWSCA